MEYIRRDLPPVISIHGDSDPIVPYDQGTRLHEALDDAGVPNKLVTVQGGGHGGFTSEENVRIYNAILDFLRTHDLMETSNN